MTAWADDLNLFDESHQQRLSISMILCLVSWVWLQLAGCGLVPDGCCAGLSAGGSYRAGAQEQVVGGVAAFVPVAVAEFIQELLEGIPFLGGDL